jgi:hypothetical protein
MEQFIDDVTKRGKTVILFAVEGNLELVIRLDNKTNLRPEGNHYES